MLVRVNESLVVTYCNVALGHTCHVLGTLTVQRYSDTTLPGDVHDPTNRKQKAMVAEGVPDLLNWLVQYFLYTN